MKRVLGLLLERSAVGAFYGLLGGLTLFMVPASCGVAPDTPPPVSGVPQMTPSLMFMGLDGYFHGGWWLWFLSAGVCGGVVWGIVAAFRGQSPGNLEGPGRL